MTLALAVVLTLPPLPANLVAGPYTGTGHMSDASFHSVIHVIESTIPGMGSSMYWARASGDVGFGVLKPGTTDAQGSVLAGVADADTCLVDVTLSVEELAATLVHEWTHQLALSGSLGADTQVLSSPCQEVVALIQEMVYVNARATWLFNEFGFSVLPCYHFNHARQQYLHFVAHCHDPLPSWVFPAPTAAAHCK